MTKDCNLPGQFQLEGIPPMPRGQPQIEISYDIDSNGILNVNAVEKSSGKSNKITISNNKGRLSPEEIEKMIREAEQFKSQDEENKGKIESKNSLENYLYQMKNSVIDEKNQISEDDKGVINDTVKEELDWLYNNPNETKDVYDKRLEEVSKKLTPILQKSGGGESCGGEVAVIHFLKDLIPKILLKHLRHQSQVTLT